MKHNRARSLNASATTAVLAASLHFGATAYASTDYPPAIWTQAYAGNWYTTGNGHKFLVIHDMEGYYLSTISMIQNGGGSGQVSVHYCVNGLKDTTSDHPAGELTQMVREAYYAWHARCWNTYSAGTEHEGFASNPAWYTEAMYQTSSSLQRHLCDGYGITKDRNHIVGHNEKSNANWRTYAESHFGSGFDASCNSHSDPGAYWNWNHLMALVNYRNKLCDIEADNKTDCIGWRPSTGIWCIRYSSTGGTVGVQWGTNNYAGLSDIPVPGDFDGDNKMDCAVWRPSVGNWCLRYTATGATTAIQWGTNNIAGFSDIPVPGDYDGDGKTDCAIWRPSNGNWSLRYSSGGTIGITWGTNNVAGLSDIPVPGDYDGDGKTDCAVWRPSVGSWCLRYSSGGTAGIQWGTNNVAGVSDIPVPGDYDGDGKTDCAVWRPSNGTWCLLYSSGGNAGIVTGVAGDIPAPGDYDGDGTTDCAVWRPSNGTWYIRNSSTGLTTTIQWGTSGDIPAPLAVSVRLAFFGF